MSTSSKRALITGITGQDGSYLAEFLVKKGYQVFGLTRDLRNDSFRNIEKLYQNRKITLIKGDLGQLESLTDIIKKANPDEIYNLGAQSDDVVSLKFPEETYNINYRSLGYLVDVGVKLNPNVRIFQASSAKMFGAATSPQNENTPFCPTSPYGEAKLRAYNEYVIEYRKKHKLFICSGILFNHESPRRGENFVTKVIIISLIKIKLGLMDYFELSDFSTVRDWGFAGDYVEAMWMMLQIDTPEDFVISTGEGHTIKDFVNEVVKVLGMDVRWEGKDENEVLKDSRGRVILRRRKIHYNPNHVENSVGDSSKIRKMLGWKPKHNFKELVAVMVEADLSRINNNI